MAKLSKYWRDYARREPCGVCGAPPLDNFSRAHQASADRQALPPHLEGLVDALNALSKSQWAPTARELLAGPICRECEEPLKAALGAEEEARQLAQQAVDIDPDNATARDLVAQLGAPEERLPFEIGHSAPADPLEPARSQADLDRQQDIRSGFVMDQELDESAFGEFVDRFERIQRSEYFAPAFRDGRCIGVWIAWQGETPQEWQTVVPLTPATLVYMVEALVRDGAVKATPGFADTILQRDYKTLQITVNDRHGSLIDFDATANRDLPVEVEGRSYWSG